MNHSRPGRTGCRGALAAGVLAAGAASMARRRVGRVVVTGESMLPTLAPGDRVLVLRGSRPRLGDVVALVDPRRVDRTMLKRVAATPGEVAHGIDGGRSLPAGTGYVVVGDNPDASTDSRDFGAVPPALITGVALYRYAPPERAGPLSPRVDFSAPSRAIRRLLGRLRSLELLFLKARR